MRLARIISARGQEGLPIDEKGSEEQSHSYLPNMDKFAGTTKDYEVRDKAQCGEHNHSSADSVRLIQ